MPAITHPLAELPRVGAVIAERYRLLAPLGEGGIGTVFLAEDAILQQRVAVKLLKRQFASDPEITARFDREAHALTTLAHEHIVRALSFGRTLEGDLCLVLELAAGETLRAVLRRSFPQPLAPAVAVEIARQLGEALCFAHARGVVHRDLKPENVMIATRDDGGPAVKVLDFGMARLLDERPGAPVLTRKGAVFGTPEYMPPEQAMGHPADARADQYALGVMVFEMLAGRRPFRADTPLDVVQLQIRQPAPSLASFAPDVPPAVCAVVARMLAKRHDERYPDVATAATALMDAVHPERAPTMPSSPSARGWWQRITGGGLRR